LGIVLKQASRASISSYLGAIIGFVNVAIVMNQLFTTEQFGLRSVLLDIAVLFSMFANLGTNKSIVRFNPFFSSNGKSDSGLFTYSLLVSIAGFFFISIAFLLLREPTLDYFNGRNALFGSYFWAVFPLAFFMLINLVLQSKLQAEYNTAYASFLNNVLTRLLNTALLVLYYYKAIDFHQFIVLFILSYAVIMVLFFIYLYRLDVLNFRVNRKMFSPRVRRIYFRYSLFEIWASISTTMINKIDSIMLLMLLNLSVVAVYTNAAYLTLLISIPASSISNISFPIVARFWKRKEFKEIEKIYQQSSINQAFIGGLLFILLWVSVDNLFELQRSVYSTGKVAILILAVGRLFQIACGVNAQIISASKYYPFAAITSFSLVLLAIATNLIFIPIFGLNGAALATTISLILYNLVRLIFIYKKMKILPFTKATIKLVFAFTLVLIIGSFLPNVDNIYIETIYKSGVVALLYFVLNWVFNISEEVNSLIIKILPRSFQK